MVFAPIADVFAPVAPILDPIADPAVVPCIADVLARVSYVFTRISHVLAPVAPIFTSIPHVLTAVGLVAGGRAGRGRLRRERRGHEQCERKSLK